MGIYYHLKMFKIATVLFFQSVLATDHDPEAIRQQIAETPITYSSSLRIMNLEANLYLNSSVVNYQAG
jgi:hypothetical protein